MHQHLPAVSRLFRRSDVRAGLFVLALSAAFGATAYDATWVKSGQPVSAAQLKSTLDELNSRISTLESRTIQVTEVANTCVSYPAGLVCTATCPANTLRTGCSAWTGGYQNPTECSGGANGCDCVISTGGANNIAVIAYCASLQ